jgi:hypothetical protein
MRTFNHVRRSLLQVLLLMLLAYVISAALSIAVYGKNLTTSGTQVTRITGTTSPELNRQRSTPRQKVPEQLSHQKPQNPILQTPRLHPQP